MYYLLKIILKNMEKVEFRSIGFDGREQVISVGINSWTKETSMKVFWIVNGLQKTTKELPRNAHCGNCSLFHPESDHVHNCIWMHNVKLQCMPFSLTYNPSMAEKICPAWKD
jgi:hypothetical protein